MFRPYWSRATRPRWGHAVPHRHAHCRRGVNYRHEVRSVLLLIRPVRPPAATTDIPSAATMVWRMQQQVRGGVGRCVCRFARWCAHVKRRARRVAGGRGCRRAWQGSSAGKRQAYVACGAWWCGRQVVRGAVVATQYAPRPQRGGRVWGGAVVARGSHGTQVSSVAVRSSVKEGASTYLSTAVPVLT